VNLTRFSLFFPEKRDFFLENQGIFNFGGASNWGSDIPALFYSRRIGLDRGREIYVGGASRMVELWEDLAKLHRVLALLEREATVLELLDDRAEGTSVRLGSEIHAAEPDLAVVSATYLAAGARGRVGVLGPMRMDYKRSIRVVEEVSDALGDSLNH